MGKKRSSASKGSEDDYDPDSPTLLEEVLHYKSKTRRLFSPSSSTSDSSASIQSYGSIRSSGSSSGNGSVDLDELIKAAARPSSSSSGSSASRILRSLEASSEDELDETSEAPNGSAGARAGGAKSEEAALEPASPESYSTVSSG